MSSASAKHPQPDLRLAAVGLGSNLEDRLAHLRRGVAHLRSLHQSSPATFRVSRIYETAPADCPPDSPSFLNAAAVFETSLPPLELLDRLQACEIACGRPPNHGFHTPRTLDLDLLLLGDLSLSHPRLTLPHPRISLRPFVLLPLAELLPDIHLPEQSLPLARLADNFRTHCGVAIFPESL